MKGINLIGNILDSSGYASHTRNLLNSLMKFTDVKLLTQIIPGQEALLTDKELHAVKRKENFDINLIITNPLGWRMHTTNKRNWVYLVWEGDKVPKHFMNECLNEEIEYILVPSEHTKVALLNTLRDNYITFNVDKIKVTPHGVNLDLFYPMEKPEKFTFLMNKGFRNLEDRGGIQYGIKAFLEEFNDKDNVELLIKINPAYGIPDINKLMNELLIDKKKTASIKFFTENMPYDKLVKLYNMAHVFVSPTRAESFNIPCLEAMACGLPVITTNFGGQAEFVSNINGWLIGGELKEVEHELHYEGIKWLTPDINELRAHMRFAYENRSEVLGRSIMAIDKALHLTWDDTAKKIVKLI